MDDKRARQLQRDNLPDDSEVLKDIVIAQAEIIADLRATIRDMQEQFREELVKGNQSIADLASSEEHTYVLQ